MKKGCKSMMYDRLQQKSKGRRSGFRKEVHTCVCVCVCVCVLEGGQLANKY